MATTTNSEAQEALHQSDARFRMVVDSALDAVVVADAEGVILEWNRQAERTFGWRREEVIGRSVESTIVPHAFREAHREGLRRFMATGESHVIGKHLEITALHRNGREFPVELAIQAQRGEQALFTAFIRDITDRKRTEGELARARDEALEASRLKSAFLANMSHEIRTPLNGVLGMTQLLLASGLSAAQKESAEEIRSSGQALMTILNDILDLSKVEAGRMTVEKRQFPFQRLVEDVAAIAAVKAAQKFVDFDLRVSPDVPDVILGDEVRLRQVFSNLLDNAVKFTDTGGVGVSVTVVDGSPDARWIQFRVNDTGIGIPEEAGRHLFQAFSQVDRSTTRRFAGTGLGLVISRQLVELMGGTIGFESMPNCGSSFWAMLPYSELGMPREPVSLPQDFKVLVGMPSVHCSRITEHLDRWAVPYEYFSHPEALSAAVRAALGKLVVITQADWSGPDDGWLEAGRAVLYYPILPGPTMDESHLHSDAIRLQFPIRPSQLRSALLAAVAPSGNVQSSPKISVEKRTRRGKVLLVEDNVVNQKVARRLLERCGCEVAVAEDGQDALDKLDLDAYDLVLMDCHMPRLDGYQATHVIREKKQDWSRVPIVALTASVMEDDRRRCLNAGMNDFLPKPLELDALQAVLERWLPGPE